MNKEPGKGSTTIAADVDLDMADLTLGVNVGNSIVACIEASNSAKESVLCGLHVMCNQDLIPEDCRRVTSVVTNDAELSTKLLKLLSDGGYEITEEVWDVTIKPQDKEDEQVSK